MIRKGKETFMRKRRNYKRIQAIIFAVVITLSTLPVHGWLYDFADAGNIYDANEVSTQDIAIEEVAGIRFIDIEFDYEFETEEITLDSVESFPLEYFIQDNYREVSVLRNRDTRISDFNGFVVDKIPSYVSAVNNREIEVSGFEANGVNEAEISPFNTNPNLAFPLLPNVPETRDAITAPGQVRWYFMELTQRSRLTAVMHMPTNADFDLLVFRLNPVTMRLNL